MPQVRHLKIVNQLSLELNSYNDLRHQEKLDDLLDRSMFPTARMSLHPVWVHLEIDRGGVRQRI